MIIRLSLAILYLFFGVLVTAASWYFDNDTKEIGMFIFLFWPLALIAILLILLGFCAFRIGRLIGEWAHKKCPRKE